MHFVFSWRKAELINSHSTNPKWCHDSLEEKNCLSLIPLEASPFMADWRESLLMMHFKDGERIISAADCCLPSQMWNKQHGWATKEPLPLTEIGRVVRGSLALASASASHPRKLLWNAMEDRWNCNGCSGMHRSQCCLWLQSITSRCNWGSRGGTINTVASGLYDVPST